MVRIAECHIVKDALRVLHEILDFQEAPLCPPICPHSHPPAFESCAVIYSPPPCLIGEKQCECQAFILSLFRMDQGEQGVIQGPFIGFYTSALVRQPGASAGGIGEVTEIALELVAGETGPFPFALFAFRHSVERREIGVFVSLIEGRVAFRVAQFEIPSFRVLPSLPPVW